MGAWSETVISSQSPERESPVSPHGPGGERHSTRSHHEGTRAFSLSYSRRGATAAPSSPAAPAAPLAAAVLAACGRSGDGRLPGLAGRSGDGRLPGLAGSSCEPRSGLSSSAAASVASLLSLLDHTLSLPALPLPEARCSSLSRVFPPNPSECRLGSIDRARPRCMVAEEACAMRSSRLCVPGPPCSCRTYLYEGGKPGSASVKP